MNLKLTAALVAIALTPLTALAQQPQAAPKPTKADAERVVKTIAGDKAKTAIYCQIADLGDQISQAIEKNDEKKADQLADQADELGAKIGPGYIALMDGLPELDPKSKEGEDIEKLLADLDALCAKK